MTNARLLALACAAPAVAHAEVHECRVVEASFTPAVNESTQSARHERSQMVVWLETASGEYQNTLFVTAQTGRFGLGNRPGRWDFNSGPMWPYGRREATFPVWAHRKPQTYSRVIFQNVEGVDTYCSMTCLQNDPTKTQADCDAMCAYPTDCESLTGAAFSACGDNNLSHPYDQSSPDPHYCRPINPIDTRWQEADAMSCASPFGIYTDKGKFSQLRTSLYPPRVDLAKTGTDSPSVDLYRMLAGFDAVSQATPPAGTAQLVKWPIPPDLPSGDYVLWVEVSQAFDQNQTYSVTSYPAPPSTGDHPIEWSDYGLPYRGQPSIVYQVPFTIGSVATVASTADYAGYGDPTGADGAVRPPDSTITTDTPGSGASRLQLVSDSGTLYRVRVVSRPELDYAEPGKPDVAQVVETQPTSATIQFAAPGDDGLVGKVSGYEVRYLANTEMTEDNFTTGTPATTTIVPVDAGQLQTLDLTGLLPETDYWVGIRAYDDCFNTSPVTIVKLTTADRPVGSVNACFIATAAYGSLLANDVELLRAFRDTVLARSVMGELAIETYYTFGPPVAGVVGESDLLRTTARSVLQPVIDRVRVLRYR